MSPEALAAETPDELVEALTLTRSPAEVAAGVTRPARGGIAQFIAAPVADDGRLKTTLECFQAEVVPRVRHELAPEVVGAV